VITDHDEQDSSFLDLLNEKKNISMPIFLILIRIAKEKDITEKEFENYIYVNKFMEKWEIEERILKVIEKKFEEMEILYS
jgi:hypothetical protein